MRRLLLSATLVAGLVAPGALAAQDLPEALSGLGLTNIESREKPRAEYGRKIDATLPGGARIEIELDRNGGIEEIEAKGRTLFPVAEVLQLIPQAVRAHQSFPGDASLEKLEFERDGRIELEGKLADGREFDAEFAANGELLDLDIDD